MADLSPPSVACTFSRVQPLRTTCARVVALVAALVAAAPADIVWEGKRVESWPPEAFASHPAPGGTLLPPSGRIAGPPAFGGRFPRPRGEIKGLVLLVDFPDSPSPVTSAQIDAWLNAPGFSGNGCHGSVRDFYLDVSNGMVDLRNEIFGWYRAKNPKSWYEGGTGYERAAVLVAEVLAAFDGQVDFKRYDNDRDGSTEAVSIVYAGAGSTWAQGLWPHAGSTGETRDGVRIPRYQMTDMTGNFGLFVFVHETGHMLFGWPDLYWYGDYCSMGNRPDDRNPVAINDYFRADQGWIPVEEIDPEDTGRVATAPGARAWLLRNPRKAQEGFLWSYARKAGRQSVLRGSGLIVHHFDQSIRGNFDAQSLTLRVVQADGLSELQARQWPSPGSDARDLFQDSTRDHISDIIFPATRWYDGTTSGLAISAIGAPGDSIAFRLGPPRRDTSWFEAESAQVVSGSLRTEFGASAGGCVAGLAHPESRIVFDIASAIEGDASLIVRHSNRSGTISRHRVQSGAWADTVTFAATAGTTWDSVRLAVRVVPGWNRIVLSRISGDAWIDAIRVESTAPPVEAHPTAARAQLRREGRFLVAPEAWAGATLSLVDAAGRARSDTRFVRSGAVARAELAADRTGVLVWIVRRHGMIVAQGKTYGGN